MGAEAVVAGTVAAVQGVGAVFGAYNSHKGRKDTKKQLNEARQEQSRMNQKVEAEQTRIANDTISEKKKLAAKNAGAGRRRVRGGLFGDSEPTAGTISPTLG